jgi:integrase
LSDRAIAILEKLPREDKNDHVFIGAARRGHLPSSAMLAVLRSLREGVTVHGLRSTFRDYAGDRTHFPREVIEHALAHGIPDAAEKAYRRGTAFEKRRELMGKWSSYCASKRHAGGNVIELRA